eukprot:17350-Heterococcus_DN1.PRE.2
MSNVSHRVTDSAQHSAVYVTSTATSLVAQLQLHHWGVLMHNKIAHSVTAATLALQPAGAQRGGSWKC